MRALGRYQIDFAAIAAVKQRDGLLGLIWPGLDVYLHNGRILRLNQTEREAFTQEQEIHTQTMAVMGMIQSGQKRL